LIWINEPGRIFIARRGRSELTNTILTAAEVRDLVERMLKSSGRRVDLSTPFVDAMLPDGSRLHVVIPDITRRHWSVNIRKFLLPAHSLDELVALGTLTPPAARFLEASVASGLNIIVAGGTQAGKTTLLNCLAAAIPARERVVTCEEVFELRIPLPDVVAMQTRQTNLEGSGEVRLRRLVKEALRMRPDRILVGEVRQEECLDLLIALNSGLPDIIIRHSRTMTRRAALYARISQDRAGEGLGVDRQEADCRALAKRKGWRVQAVYRDNDLSATSGKRRPGYSDLLAALEAGTIDAVLVWDLDRLHRRPVELEHFLDIADRHGVALASVGGEVDLATEQGRLVARIKGAVARAEAEGLSRRVRRRVAENAAAGRPTGGGRPFGFEADELTVREPEAVLLRAACDQVLAGDSLGSIMRDWDARGVLTARGNRWNRTSLRQLLLRPRNAGLREHRGQVVGLAAWPPIVDREVWEAVTAVLTDGARTPSIGNARKRLLAGLARCGACGEPMRSGTANGGTPIYRCAASFTPERPGPHAARNVTPVDELVTRAVIARLSQPDALDLLTPDNRAEAKAVSTELRAVRVRLDQAAASFADGDITAEQLSTITRRLRGRLLDLERQQAVLMRGSALAGLAGANVADRWDRLELARKRAVIDLLLQVRIRPSGRRGREFRPELVEIIWRGGEPSSST